MYKSARIIKKGSEPMKVGLSKLEKPNIDKYSSGINYHSAMNKYRESFEWHDVKDEKEFDTFAFCQYNKEGRSHGEITNKEWGLALSEGIDIDPKRVVINCCQASEGHFHSSCYRCDKQYATLIQPESKEEGEDELWDDVRSIISYTNDVDLVMAELQKLITIKRK